MPEAESAFPDVLSAPHGGADRRRLRSCGRILKPGAKIERQSRGRGLKLHYDQTNRASSGGCIRSRNNVRG